MTQNVERLTYPRPLGLIEDLAKICIYPDGDVFPLFRRHLCHGDAGLQLDGDIVILKESGSGRGIGCTGGIVGHEKSWRGTGLAKARRA